MIYQIWKNNHYYLAEHARLKRKRKYSVGFSRNIKYLKKFRHRNALSPYINRFNSLFLLNGLLMIAGLLENYFYESYYFSLKPALKTINNLNKLMYLSLDVKLHLFVCYSQYIPMCEVLRARKLFERQLE